MYTIGCLPCVIVGHATHFTTFTSSHRPQHQNTSPSAFITANQSTIRQLTIHQLTPPAPPAPPSPSPQPPSLRHHRHEITLCPCVAQGLGNKFLDDLRKADVFLHVIDASGMTNEKGENTVGYDPTNDVAWLRFEIHRCVGGGCVIV